MEDHEPDLLLSRLGLSAIRMRLQLENGFEGEVTSAAALAAALSSLDTSSNTFAILSDGDDRFIQTARQDDGFIVEKRDGNFRAHFCASRPGTYRPLEKQSFFLPRADLGQDRFALDEVSDLFVSYWQGTSSKAEVDWTPMDMPDPAATSTKLASWMRMALWAVAIVLFLALLGRMIWSQFAR